MPLKMMSRAWGKFNDLELPMMLRKPLLGLYVWMFDCNLSEAEDPDLNNYKNLGEFFRRTLKPGVRTVDTAHDLVIISLLFKVIEARCSHSFSIPRRYPSEV